MTIILQIRILKLRERKRFGQGHKDRKWHSEIQTQDCLTPEAVSLCYNALQWGKQTRPSFYIRSSLSPTDLSSSHSLYPEPGTTHVLGICALGLFLSPELLPSLLHLTRACSLVKDQVRCPSSEKLLAVPYPR